MVCEQKANTILSNSNEDSSSVTLIIKLPHSGFCGDGEDVFNILVRYKKMHVRLD